VTVPPGERYNIRFQPAARRAISERLPESVAAAVLEFCEAALAVNPQRVGKPLFGPLAGCHGARRGTYRIVYRIAEASRIVHVLDVESPQRHLPPAEGLTGVRCHS
jgi:mRNA-degrading endonuclease RelE of RelBE toxin-antitoxin system